jgi:hypothetical protein
MRAFLGDHESSTTQGYVGYIPVPMMVLLRLPMQLVMFACPSDSCLSPERRALDSLIPPPGTTFEERRRPTPYV